MHALNLGFTLWVLGSTLKLLIEQWEIWGGADVDLASRFKSAWMHFNGWAKQKGIPSFRRKLIIFFGLETILLTELTLSF